MPFRRASAWNLRSRSKSPSLRRRRVDVDLSQRHVECYVYDTPSRQCVWCISVIVAASNFVSGIKESHVDDSTERQVTNRTCVGVVKAYSPFPFLLWTPSALNEAESTSKEVLLLYVFSLALRGHVRESAQRVKSPTY